MLKFALLGMPVRVEGWFWLSTVLLGGGASARDATDWTEVGIWVGVVFVSILVHELGHALCGRRYGASPFIRLHGFGGVTFLPGAHFTRAQKIAVSAAGPAAGLLLGLLVLALAQLTVGLPLMARLAIRDALYVNFVWTILNLLPIQPLDGGQILGHLLGPKRLRLMSAISVVVAVGLCAWALSTGRIFSALFLAMLAYYNFRREPVEGGVMTP